MKKDLQAFIKLRSELILKSIESLSVSGYEPNLICFTDAVSGLPEHFYSEKVITLDVSVKAVGSFMTFDDCIETKVKFSGKDSTLVIKLLGIVNVVGKENNNTVIVFNPNNGFAVSGDLTTRYIEFCENGGEITETSIEKPAPVKKNHLTIVK